MQNPHHSFHHKLQIVDRLPSSLSTKLYMKIGVLFRSDDPFQAFHPKEIVHEDHEQDCYRKRNGELTEYVTDSAPGIYLEKQLKESKVRDVIDHRVLPYVRENGYPSVHGLEE